MKLSELPVRTIIKLHDHDDDEPRAYTKRIPNDRRGHNNRIFTVEQVRAMRASYAKYLRLIELVGERYQGKSEVAKNKRAKLREFLFRRYGVEGLERRFGCTRTTAYAIVKRMSYQEVE